jgi:hypothetical protein
MSKQKIPGFTSEAAMCKKIENYSGVYFITTERFGNENMVIPNMMPLYNCSAGSRRSMRQCVALCDFIGGGMTTEADGSITCWA